MKPLALNRIALVLSFAGIYISGVLSIGAYFSVSIPCGTSHGCDMVAAHPSSHVLGIPNAYIGFFAYIILAILTAWRMSSPEVARKTIIAGYAITAVGTLASLALTYVSFAIINAECMWCLSSAAVMILLLVVHSLLMQAKAPQEVPHGSPVLLVILALACFVGISINGVSMTSLANTPLDALPDVPMSTIVPADAHIYGDAKAPVTIVEFGDLLCPSCKSEYPLIQKFVGEHPGQVRYVFREFPLVGAKGHEQSGTAAIAAEIASEKGNFWPFVSVMYAKNEDEVSSIDAILDIASSFGIDRGTALRRMNDEHDPAFQRMSRDLHDGGQLHVHLTPTFILLAPNTKPHASMAANLWDDLKRAPYSNYIK